LGEAVSANAIQEWLGQESFPAINAFHVGASDLNRLNASLLDDTFDGLDVH
jgi:hypothetical protein